MKYFSNNLSLASAANRALETGALWEQGKNPKDVFSTAPTALGKLAKNIEFPTVPTAPTTVHT
jgi:hypothetical protein